MSSGSGVADLTDGAIVPTTLGDMPIGRNASAVSMSALMIPLNRTRAPLAERKLESSPSSTTRLQVGNAVDERVSPLWRNRFSTAGYPGAMDSPRRVYGRIAMRA